MSSLLADKKGHEAIIWATHGYDVDGDIESAGESWDDELIETFSGTYCYLFRTRVNMHIVRRRPSLSSHLCLEVIQFQDSYVRILEIQWEIYCYLSLAYAIAIRVDEMYDNKFKCLTEIGMYIIVYFYNVVLYCIVMLGWDSAAGTLKLFFAIEITNS